MMSSQKVIKFIRENEFANTFFSVLNLPKTSPKIAPKLQKMIECHSSWIFIQMIANAADVIPVNKNDWNVKTSSLNHQI